MTGVRTMRRMLITAWSRPPAAGAGGPGARDVVLVVAAGAVSVFEGALRPDLAWPVATTLVTVAILPVLLWRRTHPLAGVAAMTLTTTAFALAQAAAGVEPNALVATVVLLAVPYALFRWGSGRDRIVGGTLIAIGLAASSGLGPDPAADAIAGVAFVGGAALIGALRRERLEARARELEAARAREREALARDLHDTVAHHVSAIVIRAQVASADPSDTARVAESLGVIEDEAQAVLTDVRSLVRALRSPADYAPAPGLAEISALAEPGPPAVTVRVAAPTDPPNMIASTLFRVAQEGIANARRHARSATRIDVSVAIEADAARIVVRDDGAAVPPVADRGGHGLRGVAERAALLGGEVAAGPDPDGGWTLHASIPLRGEP